MLHEVVRIHCKSGKVYEGEVVSVDEGNISIVDRTGCRTHISAWRKIEHSDEWNHE